jgi:hypothetical protein
MHMRNDHKFLGDIWSLGHITEMQPISQGSMYENQQLHKPCITLTMNHFNVSPHSLPGVRSWSICKSACLISCVQVQLLLQNAWSWYWNRAGNKKYVLLIWTFGEKWEPSKIPESVTWVFTVHSDDWLRQYWRKQMIAEWCRWYAKFAEVNMREQESSASPITVRTDTLNGPHYNIKTIIFCC